MCLCMTFDFGLPLSCPRAVQAREPKHDPGVGGEGGGKGGGGAGASGEEYGRYCSTWYTCP